MEETPNSRIRQLLESKGMKVPDAAERSGVKQSTLYGVIQGKTAPSFETLQSILTAFPDISSDWLLLGTGPMLRDGRALSPTPVAAAPVASVAARPAAHSEELVQAARMLAENEFMKQTILSQNQQIASLQATVERLLDMLPVGKLYPDNYAAEAPVMYTTTTPQQPAGFRYGQQEEPEAFAPMWVGNRFYGGLTGEMLSVVGKSLKKSA